MKIECLAILILAERKAKKSLLNSETENIVSKLHNDLNLNKKTSKVRGTHSIIPM